MVTPAPGTPGIAGSPNSSGGGLWLGLDLGTTNVKALALDDDGLVVARGQRGVDLCRRPDGAAEQNLDQIWNATLDAIRQIGEQCDLQRVEAIGVASQGGAIQLLDGDDRPCGPVISWMDSRGAAFDDRLREQRGRDWLIEHTGRAATAMAVGQLLRLRHESPTLLEPPNRVGFVGDVIVGRLGGRRAHDPTSLAIGCMLNPRQGDTDDAMLDVLGLHRDQLPPVHTIRTPAGSLCNDTAYATGLNAGIPVAPAVHDQYAAALAAGATEPGDAMLGTGTAWVLLAVTDGPIESLVEDAFVAPHLVPDRAGQIISLHTGGAALDWATTLTGYDGDIDALIASIAPGAEGLRFWPFLSPHTGAGLPVKPEARLVGLRDSHRDAHVVRAVLEGLVFELNRMLRLIGSAHFPLKRVLMTGGATGRVTPQLVADVTGLPIAYFGESAMSALGAAVIARGLIESDTPLSDLQRAMTLEDTTLSASSHAPTYHELYDRYVASIAAEAQRDTHD